MTRPHTHSKTYRSGRTSTARRDDSGRLPRRGVLAGVAAGAAVAVAGCSGIGGDGTTDRPDPATMTTDDACDVCGMIIPNHPGPTTEIFYPDRQPSGHENPARFDSTWEAFQYDFDRQDRGWTSSVTYVTDYSEVDYSVFEESGDLLISTHPQAEAFVPAAEVTFVAGSEVKGAMGKDLIAFADRSDADAFNAEHGGELVTVDEVTPELIAQLGM